MSAAAMRQCLEDCDVARLRRLWGEVCPHLPLPTTDEAMLVALHIARTQAASIKFSLRAYSHRWLTERALPSGLPDWLKPRAERMYPVIADAVGISVNTSPRRRELGNAVRTAMSDAVMEAYADGRRDPTFVKDRMMEARERVLRSA